MLLRESFSLASTGRNQVGKPYTLGIVESPTVVSKDHSIVENVKQYGRARFLSYTILARVIYRILGSLASYQFTFLPNSKKKKKSLRRRYLWYENTD